MAPGCHAATAAAFAAATLVLYMTVSETTTSVGSMSTSSKRTASTRSGSTGSLLSSAAAGFAVFDAVPSSRRVTASAVHISGAAAGPSPLPPVTNQDNRFAPRALTERDTEAGWAAAGAAPAEPAAATVPSAAGASLPAGVGAAVEISGESTVTEAGISEIVGAPPPAGAPGAVTGESLLIRGAREAAGAEAPLRGVAAPLLSAGAAAEPRPDRRAGEVVLGEDEPAEEASVLLPAEPVESAKAMGMEAMAEPTPRATASAPTRPT